MVTSESNDNTFTALDYKISTSEFNKVDSQEDTSTSKIDIDKDYTFDSTWDSSYANGIEITNKNIVIEGNGHVIDAKCDSGIFTIKQSNVTISNLILRNANNSAIIIINSTLKTYNVTFENNTKDNGGAISGNNTTFISVNDKYVNNIVERFGSSILLQDNSSLYLSGATFKNKNSLIWGEIDLTDSQFSITDMEFGDIKSKYNPILHADNSYGTIQNVNFKNLYANLTSGAVSFVNIGNEIIIRNCTFTNVTSNKDAGAVYFISNPEDINPIEEERKKTGKLFIEDSSFINCSSEFGGALMQLDGSLTIKNTQFTDNLALYGGGSIYTSYVNTTLEDVNFKDNSVIYHGDTYNSGGAIFNDKGNLTVNRCNFTDNYAENASAIYLYDSTYIIKNSNFKGENTNYIFSEFDGRTSIIENSNTFVNPNNVLNLTDYVSVIEGWAKQVDYNPVILDEKLVNESYFNLLIMAY